MPPIQNALLRLSATQLAQRIAAGDISSGEAVEACIARIEQVNPALNAVVVSLFDSARQAAAAADSARSRGETLGPLHGVPFTVKENFHVAGTAATMGLTTLAKNVHHADGILVRRWKQAGGVLLGKTNVPQLMIWHECDNPLYGRTNNPRNLDRTPGGSTGGEAAIIAAHGSPLGLGGDLGGSIRVPCHYTGIHGLKPTSGRLTRQGVQTNLRGMEAVQFQPGPMARSVADLELGLRVLIEGAPADRFQADVAPAPLGCVDAIDVSKLRIAFWEDDGFFTASPAIRRAVRDAARALQSAGATVLEFSPPQVETGLRIYYGLCAADGGADARRLTRGGELDWRVTRLLRLAGMPRWMRRGLVQWLSWSGQRYFATLLNESRARTADEYWQLTAAALDYSRRFMEALDTADCDAFISPVHALPAPLHRKPIDLFAPASYAFLPNLLGVPAGAVSISQVGANEESDRPPSRDPVVEKARQTEAGSSGLPVAVQVAAKHWREDIVLAVMKTLEAAFPVRDAS